MGASEATLTVTLYPPEIRSFSVGDLVKDCSVVFYTQAKKSRPWLGLFVELIEENESVKIRVEWLKKDNKYFILDSKPDGSVYCSVLDVDAVMFTDVLRNISYQSNRKGPYILDADTKKVISEAYDERDTTLQF